MPSLSPIELPELLEKIFSLLELEEIGLAERVCRTWLAAARSSPALEKTRFRRPELRPREKTETFKVHPYFTKGIQIGLEALTGCQFQRIRPRTLGTHHTSPKTTSKPPSAAHPNTTTHSQTYIAPRLAPTTLPASSYLHISLSNDTMLDLIAYATPDEDDCCERCESALDDVVGSVQYGAVVVGRDGFVRVGQVLDEVGLEPRIRNMVSIRAYLDEFLARKDAGEGQRSRKRVLQTSSNGCALEAQGVGSGGHLHTRSCWM